MKPPPVKKRPAPQRAPRGRLRWLLWAVLAVPVVVVGVVLAAIAV